VSPGLCRRRHAETLTFPVFCVVALISGVRVFPVVRGSQNVGILLFSVFSASFVVKNSFRLCGFFILSILFILSKTGSHADALLHPLRLNQIRVNLRHSRTVPFADLRCALRFLYIENAQRETRLRVTSTRRVGDGWLAYAEGGGVEDQFVGDHVLQLRQSAV
jgi:hypothetical protein